MQDARPQRRAARGPPKIPAAERAEQERHLCILLADRRHVDHLEDFRRYSVALGWTALLLLVLTANQLHSAWQEESIWSLPDVHEWQGHVEWAVNLSRELVERDPEALSIVDGYAGLIAERGEMESCSDDAARGQGHYSHPDAVGRAIRSHWQFDLLSTAMLLNCMFVLSLVLRWTYLWEVHSFKTMLYAMNVLWASALLQSVAACLWLFVAGFSWTWLSLSGLCVQVFAFFLEFASAVILWYLRGDALYIARLANTEANRRKVFADVLRSGGVPEETIEVEVDDAELKHGGNILEFALETLLTLSANTNAALRKRKHE